MHGWQLPISAIAIIKKINLPEPEITEAGAVSFSLFGILERAVGASKELADWARLCDAVAIVPRDSRRVFTMSLYTV